MILDDLVKNTSLKTLDLGVIEGSIRKNSLGVDGARCIAALLIQNKTLETLKLEDNDIGIAGAEIIAIALKQNKTLKNFKLSENMVKTQGAEQILKNSAHLQSLDLGKNFIKSSIGSFLRGYFETNKHIRRLNIEMN
jgi:Ran GTPase-activating protein (RanGAP) involved in mRNA processing and transport